MTVYEKKQLCRKIFLNAESFHVEGYNWILGRRPESAGLTKHFPQSLCFRLSDLEDPIYGISLFFRLFSPRHFFFFFLKTTGTHSSIIHLFTSLSYLYPSSHLNPRFVLCRVVLCIVSYHIVLYCVVKVRWLDGLRLQLQ